MGHCTDTLKAPRKYGEERRKKHRKEHGGLPCKKTGFQLLLQPNWIIRPKIKDPRICVALRLFWHENDIY
jgi:hypothetical protein